MVHIDFLTVIIAAIIYMIIKSLWYSPFLFGTVLHKLSGIKNADMRNKYLCYPLNFVVALILSYFISLIEIYIGATSFWDGIVAGFVLWLGFVFTTQITSIIWVKNTSRTKIFLIRNGFLLLTFMVMGAILVG
jgi:hypothetical protein